MRETLDRVIEAPPSPPESAVESERRDPKDLVSVRRFYDPSLSGGMRYEALSGEVAIQRWRDHPYDTALLFPGEAARVLLGTRPWIVANEEGRDRHWRDTPRSRKKLHRQDIDVVADLFQF